MEANRKRERSLCSTARPRPHHCRTSSHQAPLFTVFSPVGEFTVVSFSVAGTMPQAADMINLGFLSDSERELILEVLQRDEELRQMEEQRVR